MNLIDLVVLQVLGEPQKKYGKWFVEVKCEAYVDENSPLKRSSR